MISWLSFGIALLKVAYSVLDWFNRRALIDEGRRQVILELSLRMAVRVASKKKIQEWVDGLDDDEVDEELLRLERE